MSGLLSITNDKQLTVPDNASVSGTNTGDQTITLTGDVTGSGTSTFAATIALNAVTNAKLAQMPANTIKGNNMGIAANAADLSAADVSTMLDLGALSTLGIGEGLEDDGADNLRVKLDGSTLSRGPNGLKVADKGIALGQIADQVQGDILYFGASGVATLLAPGSSGQFLKTQGVGANPLWADIAGSVPQNGSATALKVTNNATTPNTKIDIGARTAVLITTAGQGLFVSSPSVTIDLTTTGANGMDTGARPTSGWVYCYLISNGGTTAGLASTSSTSPTMPSGYTYKLYVGAMYCDGSQSLMRSLQYGKRAQYVVTASTNTASLPTMASGGAVGNAGTPTYVSFSTSGYVPPTAGRIFVACQVDGYGTTILAPNPNYGGYQSTSNPPFQVNFPQGDYNMQLLEFALESANLYWASSGGTTTINCFGWEDNAVAA